MICFITTIQNLTKHQNISRGLFEKHKQLFALMICIQVLRHSGEIVDEEWCTFLQGASTHQLYQNIFSQKYSLPLDGLVHNVHILCRSSPPWIAKEDWEALKAVESELSSTLVNKHNVIEESSEATVNEPVSKSRIKGITDSIVENKDDTWRQYLTSSNIHILSLFVVLIVIYV